MLICHELRRASISDEMMSKQKQSAIIISISSDIGTALAKRWMNRGWNVYGTYRTKSNSIEEISTAGVEFVYCDLSDISSIQGACLKFRTICSSWDILVLAPGSLEPVGPFIDCDFNEWADSIRVNFTNQLRIVQELIPTGNKANRLGPCVLFFAGGGTNSATQNFSAYTISKIALIKMCELLDAEISDMRFSIVGPGWVKTKIHQTTLDAGERSAGDAFYRIKDKLNSGDFIPMERVLDFCDWVVNAPREVVGGRNFSVVHDRWGNGELDKMLTENQDGYKLRRYGNDWLVDG